MTPNSDNLRSGKPHRRRLNLVGDAHQVGDQSVFELSATPVAAFPSAARLDRGDLEGTVGAGSMTGHEQSYGAGSGALLSDGPLGQSKLTETRIAPGLRASLITELREISGQVNRMMTQVDRAIHRLGEHAGEPLR